MPECKLIKDKVGSIVEDVDILDSAVTKCELSDIGSSCGEHCAWIRRAIEVSFRKRVYVNSFAPWWTLCFGTLNQAREGNGTEED